MSRFHATANGPVPFTPEEEAEWDEMIKQSAQRSLQERPPSELETVVSALIKKGVITNDDLLPTKA